MNKYTLPTELEIAGNMIPINSDYRDILEIFEVLNDPNLLDMEKAYIALDMFYTNDDYKADINDAIIQMFQFMSPNEDMKNPAPKPQKKPLMDWEQDFNYIVAPINRIMSTDIRGLEYMHWWTFLSAFMEIGECTFSTYVSIRDKLNQGKKLDKTEAKIYRDHKSEIVLTKRYDDTTQALMDEIMGKEA